MTAVYCRRDPHAICVVGMGTRGAVLGTADGVHWFGPVAPEHLALVHLRQETSYVFLGRLGREVESPACHVPARGAAPSGDALDVAPVVESRTFHPVDDDPSAVEHRGVQRDAAEPLQVVRDPVAAELEAALALRRAGAAPKALRRIEELLDDE